MKRKNLLILCLLFIGAYFPSNGQTIGGAPVCPPNIDFEFGNLSYWTFFRGTVASGPVWTLTACPPTLGWQTLTAGTGVDAYGGFPIVDPGGGSYALKVMHDTPLYCASRARYFVHVPLGVNNYSLIYRYAVCMQDPGHPATSQPRFMITTVDSASGLSIPCAQDNYVAGALPGFLISPKESDVYYKSWATASINLSGLAGHTVIFDATSGDCGYGGHWGYGYIDMTCGLFAIDARICDDTLATLTGPSGFSSYQWFDSVTFSHLFGSTQVITIPIPDTATTYAVIIQPYIGFGCPDTLYTRVMPSYLKINPSNDTLVCTGASVILGSGATDSALDMPLQYSWIPSSGLSCTNCPNPVASPSVTTIYTVTVTDKAGCHKAGPITVTTDRVTTTVSVVNDSCNGSKNGTATVNPVTGKPPFNYIWSTAPIQTTKTATGLAAGTYSVTITDNIGCFNTNMAKITEPPANNLSIVTSAGPTTCLGSDGYIVLSGLISGTSYTINYTFNGIPASQIQIANGMGYDTLKTLRSGIYDHITIDVSKLARPFCPFNTVGPLTLVDPPVPPKPAVGNNGPICFGDTLKLSVSDAVKGVTFSWSGPSGFNWTYPDTVKNLDTSIANATFAFTGVYVVTVTKNACTSSNSTTVLVKPIPFPSATGDSVCSGTNIQLSSFSSNGASSYRWEGPDAYSSFVQNPVIPSGKFSAAGTYTVTITLDGCPATATANVIIVQTPAAPIVSDTVYCQFDGPIPPLKAIGTNLTWYDPNGNQMLATPIPLTDVAGTTTWSVTQQTSDPNPRIPTCISPKAYETVLVYPKYFPGLTVSDTVICSGNEITFTVNNLGDDKSGLRWSLGVGDSVININPLKHAFDAIGTYTVSVTALHSVCPNPTLTKIINVFPYPILDLGPDTTICLGSQSIILADNINANTKNARWLWNTNETSPSIVVTKPGIYYVRLLIDGCPVTDTVNVLNDCFLNIPNIFTPNGDGVNDYFFPRQFLTKGLISFKMDIYNRWGQLIFTTNSLNGLGWDGKLNDVPQPEGVYVYIMEATFKDGQIEHHNGNVTLLR